MKFSALLFMRGSMEVRPPQNGLCVMRNIDSLVHCRDNHPVHRVVYSVIYPGYRDRSRFPEPDNAGTVS